MTLVSLLVSFSAFASTATSAITGRVKSDGSPAAGVTVTVTSAALQGERTTMTTRNGRYWLTALPPGRYDVTFSRAKLQTLTRRVLVELSRVSRADAVLEPSEDEDNVTSTALPLTVADTTVITSHVSDETFDRLPIRRNPYDALSIIPAPPGPVFGIVNDSTSFSGPDLGEESLQEVAILRGAMPADYELMPIVHLSQTRSGGEDYFFSLRDTLTNGLEQNVEVNAGGRILKEKLWFFLGGWNGSEAQWGDRTGYEAKLTWQAAAQHNLMLFLSDAQTTTPFFEPSSTLATLRYTGTAGPRLTTEAVVSRATTGNSQFAGPLPTVRIRQDSLFLKSTYVAGDHVLSAGGHATRHDRFHDTTTFFLNDRWRIQRFTFNLGTRFEHDRLSPRLAATFDVRGNGRQGITASFSEYTNPVDSDREITLGFATAVGMTGTIRVDAFERGFSGEKVRGAMGEFRYSLFDRFHTGASYTWYQAPTFLDVDFSEHVANAWGGFDFPIGDHEAGITAMQRYRSGLQNFTQTDLALRYSLPVSRLRLTVAADVLNLFDEQADLFSLDRTCRGWIRLRL